MSEKKDFQWEVTGGDGSFKPCGHGNQKQNQPCWNQVSNESTRSKQGHNKGTRFFTDKQQSILKDHKQQSTPGMYFTGKFETRNALATWLPSCQSKSSIPPKKIQPSNISALHTTLNQSSNPIGLARTRSTCYRNSVWWTDGIISSLRNSHNGELRNKFIQAWSVRSLVLSGQAGSMMDE